MPLVDIIYAQYFFNCTLFARMALDGLHMKSLMSL